VSYRDDNDALLARADALEWENRELRRKLAGSGDDDPTEQPLAEDEKIARNDDQITPAMLAAIKEKRATETVQGVAVSIVLLLALIVTAVLLVKWAS